MPVRQGRRRQAGPRISVVTCGSLQPDQADNIDAQKATSVQHYTPNVTSSLIQVLEYMEGGPVLGREALQAGARVPEDLARLYFRDMCKAHFTSFCMKPCVQH